MHDKPIEKLSGFIKRIRAELNHSGMDSRGVVGISVVYCEYGQFI